MDPTLAHADPPDPHLHPPHTCATRVQIVHTAVHEHTPPNTGPHKYSDLTQYADPMTKPRNQCPPMKT